MRQIRILLADDHTLILQGIRGLLADKYDVVGSAPDGKSLVAAALRLTPDLVVLDVSMPVLNGIDAAGEIKKSLPLTKLVFLTMHSNAIYLRKAFETGASGYVLKSGASEELISAIEAALRDESYISPGLGHNVIQSLQFASAKPSRAALELTARQRQILQLIAEGRQNKEIGEILSVSVKTVEFHRSRLMAKLGTYTVAELTQIAIREGLIGAGH
ncbi:MAG: response regulator transcription factor [Bryobacteraceae bacterium]